MDTLLQDIRFAMRMLLAAVSFFACYLPARRAARLDPIKALART